YVSLNWLAAASAEARSVRPLTLSALWLPDWSSYTECRVCGSGFMADDEAQVQRHDHYCDTFQNGNLLTEHEEDHLVWSSGTDLVLEASIRQSWAYRQRVAEAALVTQLDFPDFPTAYDGSDLDWEYDG